MNEEIIEQNLTTKRKKLTKKQKIFLAALDKNLGNVSDATLKTGISRGIHYHWRHNCPKYEEEFRSISEKILDFTESSLHKQIQDGNTAATIFKLKCLGKERGYIEKQYVEIDDVSKLSDEQLNQLAAISSNKG